MIYSILIIALIIGAISMQRIWYKTPEKERSKWLQQRLLWIVAGVVILLVITGRAHWLMGVLAALLALLGRITAVASYIPILKKIFGEAGMFQNQQPPTRPTTEKMTVKEAADFLGIKETASKEEIILAHKKLMQKVHPDRGGSDALAAQINEAKEVLLAARR